MSRVHARVQSLGGMVLGGLFLVLLVVLWIATHVAVRNVWLEGLLIGFLLVMAAYVVDGASESLEYKDQALVFDGWLTRRRTVSLAGIVQVLLVHEGLNPEWGIETLTCMHRDGDCERLALGPLWRRRDLEAFLADVESGLHNEKIVEEVR